MLTSSGDASRFSGQDRSMQRPWLVQTGCAAAAELGLWGVERRKMMERESDEDLRAGPIYKGRLMSGREKRGG